MNGLMAKLLEDRCEFEVVSGHPPERLREAVFRAAAEVRKGGSAPPDEQMIARPTSFDRNAILRRVADELGMTAEEVDHGLFADLKSEQRLIRFKDISAERLLQRYNVALAQAVLLRSTRVHVAVRHEPPARNGSSYPTRPSDWAIPSTYTRLSRWPIDCWVSCFSNRLIRFVQPTSWCAPQSRASPDSTSPRQTWMPSSGGAPPRPIASFPECAVSRLAHPLRR